jgi:hypothetical protein
LSRKGECLKREPFWQGTQALAAFITMPLGGM